ncbi:MAG: (d)CMP kinase [Mycoplasmatales bacterium]
MIIAIDGPAGSGKSTISKLLATELNYSYLDTGAMYRALTFYLLENNIDINNQILVASVLKNINISFNKDIVLLNDIDVTDKIRTQEVNDNISLVSTYKEVREFLVNEQRSIASSIDCILDGRDIGTVVFPNADYKFYLDASVEIRAKRRVEQNKKNNLEVDIELIKESIEKRDESDKGRKVGPLKIAQDAIYIDTSEFNIDEVVALMLLKMK